MNTPRTVAYGETTLVDKVLAYDANGVTKSVAAEATFSANGTAVQSLNAYGDKYALVKVYADDDYIGKTITVFAEYEDFVTSTTLTVVDKASGISYADTVAEVGVNTEIKGAVVDENGNRITIASYIAGLSGNGLVLDKPENAVAIATWDVDSKGNVVLSFLGSEKGEYKVQVAVSYTDGEGTKRFISGIANITVGAGEGTFEDVVVLSIGANNIVVNSDVKGIAAAPMIKDGRTFVPFRALAEAFGADVEWVEATQSVVAELNGVKVVMAIGSNEYTVNGVAKTADVAPFINGASTMVPVRFVAEAFGITVTPLYAADGSVADVLFAK
jgi:phage terminase large subunit-like protein